MGKLWEIGRIVSEISRIILEDCVKSSDKNGLWTSMDSGKSCSQIMGFSTNDIYIYICKVSYYTVDILYGKFKWQFQLAMINPAIWCKNHPLIPGREDGWSSGSHR